MNPTTTARLALGAALLLGACTSLPVSAVPDPLPEALRWELPPADSRPFLGLEVEENDSGSLDDLFFEPGVRVIGVVENSPARRAGFERRDVVLSVGGLEINDPAALDAVVAGFAPGARVVVQARRDDSVFKVPVELTARGGSAGSTRVELSHRVDRSRTLGGWATAPGGVRLVTRAEPGPLARAGVPVGSVVQTLDGQRVHSARELLRRLELEAPGERVSLGLHAPDDESRREVSVELAEPDRVLTDFRLPLLFRYENDPEGDHRSWSLLDLWVFELFQWERDGEERRWVFLELFGFEVVPYATGVGTLGS